MVPIYLAGGRHEVAEAVVLLLVLLFRFEQERCFGTIFCGPGERSALFFLVVLFFWLFSVSQACSCFSSSAAHGPLGEKTPPTTLFFVRG